MTTSASSRVLGGRWLLKEAVGDQGGMSEVFRAVDTDGEHGVVAAKLLPVLLQRDKWARRAFELEWQARHAPLDHPHIVPLLDRGREEGTQVPYLIFPWSGKTLSRVLADRDAVRWDEWWRRYGRPMLDALAHVHTQDVAHRDVKPDNVLIDDDGVPRLADFGLAKILGPLTTGLTMKEHASRPFSPREPDLGMHSPTRDLHAWAAMTYFAVSGHDPAQANHVDDPYVVLDAAATAGRSEIPQVVATQLDRCLAAPEDRPRVAAELLAAIDEACGTGPSTATPRRGRIQVRVPPNTEDRLGDQRDLSSADVRDLLRTTLNEAVVLPVPGDVEAYRLVGHQLTLRVSVHHDGRSLSVAATSVPPADVVERERSHGWSPTVSLSLDPVGQSESAAEAMSAFTHGVAEHREEAGRRERQNAKLRSLYRWRDVLALLRDAHTEAADPLDYVDVRSTRGGSFVFKMRIPPSRLLIGQQRIASAGSGHLTCEVRAVNGVQVTVHPLDSASQDVMSRGTLELDTRMSQAALKRQERALDAVLHQRTVRPDLVDLVTNPEGADRPRPTRDPTPKQPLDDDKRAALKAALGEPDLMVVQGPPGTGKTRFIAELVYQTLLKDPSARVLVACQTHAALDNALIRVRQLDPTFDVLRIARPDETRVDEAVDDLRIDAVLERWHDRAVASGNAWLSLWAKQHAVDVHAVRGSMALDTLADAVELARQLIADIKEHGRRRRSAGSSRHASRTADATATELLADLKTARMEAEARARGRLDDVIALGLLPARSRQTQLDPVTIREQALALAASNADNNRCRELVDLLGTWQARFGSSAEFNAAALTRAQVVGATCVGLGGLPGIDQVTFDLCIVDEASRATAPELFIPMSRAQRFVLVGDDRQLPPYLDRAVLTEERLASRKLSYDEIKQPFFSFLAERLPSENVVALSEQHRMHPAIGRLVSNCFYGSALRSARAASPLPTHLRTIASRPVMWLSTAHLPQRGEGRSGLSYINETEAACVADLIDGLASASETHGVRTEVAVLAAYKAQGRLLEERLAQHLSDTRLLLSVHTVDSFQGREADVVVYSATRSNPQGNFGFTRERPRLNVALSRARDLLIIVGDHQAAGTRSGENPFREVIDHVRSHPDECDLTTVSP